MVSIRVGAYHAPVTVVQVGADDIAAVVQQTPRDAHGHDGYVTLRDGRRIDTIDVGAVLRQTHGRARRRCMRQSAPDDIKPSGSCWATRYLGERPRQTGGQGGSET